MPVVMFTKLAWEDVVGSYMVLELAWACRRPHRPIVRHFDRTGRICLKRIFGKTGTHGQVGLISLLMSHL